MKKTYILLLLIAVLLMPLKNGVAQNENKDILFKIIQTSDVHGAIFPYNFTFNNTNNYSLAHVYSFVKNERQKLEQEVVLLDNGDILQGDPIVYFSNFGQPEKKHVCAAVMNYMKYDAATIGNHDIEAGHSVYDKLVNEFDFPWLAANAINTKTDQPYFKPYYIIKKGGVKIAILGLITPAIPDWLPENIWEGIRFDDMVESAKKWVKHIKEKEQPDLLIGLFHAGIDYTYNKQTAETYKNENASKLVAKMVPGFDIVMAGHDHSIYNTLIENTKGEKVLLLDPGSQARSIAVANVSLKWDKLKKEYTKELTGEILETSNYKADSMFIDTFKYYYDEAYKYVNRVIGTNKKDIDAKESLFGNSEFVDFIQKVQLDISKADISFTSPLSYKFTIKKGEITVKDMFKLYRYENLLYTMELSGKEIKNFLEFSADLWFNQMSSDKDPLLKYSISEDGKIKLTNPYYNYSSAAGIKYTIDVSKPYGEKITISGLENGEEFKLEKIYKVAINSYRGNGGGGHLTKGAGIEKEELKKRILFSTEKDLRYYIIKYIEKNKLIEAEKRNNWKIIPASWWEIAKKRDDHLLFSNSSF